MFKMRPDRSKIVDLFETDLGERITPNKRMTNSGKKPTGKANDNNKERFLRKLEDELYSQFDYKDWFQYFVHKASLQGVRYITRNYAKEYAIIKSILNEMTWVELKNMIDFVFESDQDIVEKRTVGIWILSKGWINSIYQNMTLWMEGTYKPKTAPKRNREWQPEVAEASRKESVTGLSYGKPIRGEEIPETTKPVKRKGSIRL